MENILLLPEALSCARLNIHKECVFFNIAWAGESSLSDLNIFAQMRNVAYSVNALEVAVKVGCNKFIQVGTMEEAFAQRYLDLDYLKHNFYNRHVIYAVAKIAAKKTLEVKSSQLGIDFIYVLHSHVMGPDDDKDSFLQVTLQKFITGSDLIFSSGEQYFDVISLDDCVYGYFLICKKGRPKEVYWVGSGNPRRLREYVERMHAIFPSNKKIEFGNLTYNDIIVDKSIFSISNLTKDTGYLPKMSFEQTVYALYNHLVLINKF
jgi:nucleoside-diphosphate-sugar epimerase